MVHRGGAGPAAFYITGNLAGRNQSSCALVLTGALARDRRAVRIRTGLPCGTIAYSGDITASRPRGSAGPEPAPIHPDRRGGGANVDAPGRRRINDPQPLQS